MAGWQKRCAVPDSEDEEEILSTNSYSSLGSGIFGRNEDSCRFQEVEEHAEKKKRQQNFAVVVPTTRKTITSPANLGENAETEIIDVTADRFQDDDDVDELQLDYPIKLQCSETTDKLSKDTTGQEIASAGYGLEEDNTMQSNTSSPLSSVHLSNAEMTEVLELARVPSSGSGDRQVLGTMSQPVGLEMSTSPATPVEMELDTNASTRVAPRTFRHRNPEQLYPYAIESERYKRTLKGRGLQPLRIEQRETPENDSEVSATEEQNTCVPRVRRNRLPNKKPLNIPSSPPQTPVQDLVFLRSSQGALSNLVEEDFPDLSTMLRKPLPYIARNGFKKVKTSHSYSKQARHLRRDSATGPLSASPQQQNPSTRNQPLSVFDIPPSPPTSGLRSSSSDAVMPPTNQFRMPLGLSTPQIQTPVTSSNYKSHRMISEQHDDANCVDSSGSEPVRHSDRRHRRIMSDDDLNSPGDHNSISEHESQRPDSPNFTEEEEEQLQRVQRNIRGVLPASWLRLDMKSGATKAQHHIIRRELEPSVSPERGQDHRGVARPLPRPSENYPSRKKPMTIVVSDDSSSEQQEDLARTRPQQREGREDSISQVANTFDWPASDSMEDDRIDPMLQTATRCATMKRKRPKVRQITLNYSGRSPHVENPNVTLRNRNASGREKPMKSAQHRTSRGGQRRKVRDAKPRLGILDVHQATVQCKQPVFINLALRSAHLRQDRGRQSPSKKAFRLATREDTADIQTTLASWKTGSLAPRRQTALPPSKMTLPLNVTSGNKRPSCALQGNNHQPEAIQKNTDEVFRNAEALAKGQGRVQHAIQLILARQRSQGIKGLQGTAGLPKPPPVTSMRKLRQMQISSTVRARGSARPALLETLNARGNHAPVGPNSYKTPKPLITAAAHSESNPVLDRFLSEQTLNSPANSRKIVNANALRQVHDVPIKLPSHHPKVTPSRRKLSPKQLDVRNSRFHQAIDIEDEDSGDAEVASVSVSEVSIKTALCGLGPYGTEYSLDFGIEPTTPGPHFWKPLVGESIKSIKALGILKRRNLEQVGDEAKYVCLGREREWGAWTESLHSELSEAFKEIASALQSTTSQAHDLETQLCQLPQAVDALDSISRFIAENLCFLDPIDRVSFTKHVLALVSLLLEEMNEQARTFPHDSVEPPSQSRRLLRNMTLKVLTILTQIQVISIHPLIPTEVSQRVKAMTEQAFRCSVKIVLSPDLRETWLHIRRSEDLNTYHSDERGQAACISKLLHVAIEFHLESMFQEESTKVLFDSRMTRSNDIRALDGIWRDMFTILLFYHNIPSSERVHVQWPEHKVQHWSIIKRLVESVLGAYQIDPRGQASTFNTYLRTLIGRCLKLVQQWHWQRPEGIIGMLFDFFARNNLGNLEHEYSYGPPSFLQQLRDTSHLVFLPRDSSFHIYLKLLGASLRSMRNYYPSKKIRDIAWRYMPNHGRNLPKDQSIRQEDLEALRNHHDLLCVLYWASPPDFRPRVTAIEDLVRIETSHREACHVNIRAWSNLVTYQLSTDEAPHKLEPFAIWISNVLAEALQLHNLARSEIESQAKAAELSGLGTISPEEQETMISRNQRQVEAILEDTVVSIKTAIATAQTSQAAYTLFPYSLSRVLEMFDPERPRTNSAVVNALEAYSTFAQKYLAKQGEPESQNYGDWSAFEDEGHGLGSAFLEEKVLRPVHQLLSNTMGMDNLLNEILTTKVVDTWIDIVHLAVLQGSMNWDDILGPYGRCTWSSLRDTEQTRKYTPYAFASLIEKDRHIFQEYERSVHKVWLASCLERDSLLMYQHLLTAAVLDCSNTNPLLNNMQSAIRRRHDRCTNSIIEFRNQRSGLLSTILATMRENLEYRSYHELGDGAKPKQDFVDLIKYMMSTMKANYQGLGTSANQSSVYIEFVHMVVGLLQQYTADICPIDRFFIDSPDFPAPATDPAYVVDRILNYARRFPDGKSYKQLASLVQNLCERAIIETNVENLVCQLESALCLNGRVDYGTKDNLLGFMLDKIAPVYIDISFSTRCGWLLARPFLMALRGTFVSLISWVEVGNRDNHDKMSMFVSHYLDIVFKNTTHWVDEHCEFRGGAPLPSPAWGMTLQTIMAILPLLNYLYQKWPKSNLTTDARNQFLRVKRVMRHYKHNYYTDHNGNWQPGPFASERVSRPQYNPTALFALRELTGTLNDRWQARDREGGDVYIKSSLRSEWIKVADGYSRDTDTFLNDFQEFNRVHAGLAALHEREDDEDEDFRQAKEPEQTWDWRDEVPAF